MNHLSQHKTVCGASSKGVNPGGLKLMKCNAILIKLLVMCG